MKTELVTRSVYANIIILMVTMAISGCIPFPIFETTGAKPGAIRAGSTSKAEIINKFEFPLAKTSDGRFFLYDYSKNIELCFITAGYGECLSFLSKNKGKVLIEFDNDNIVERYAAHLCNEPPDPLCDQPGIDAMWTSINQLAGEDVAAQYGQTLDEFRQAEALRNSRTEALVKAVKLADLEAVKGFIGRGWDVNAENRNGYTPLLAAASDGQVAMAKILLSYGADVNQQYYYGRTSLHRAAWEGHVGITELLLANGADVDAQDLNRGTPLHRAMHRTHVEVVKLLLVKGASVNARIGVGGGGGMPLHTAIRIGNTKVVQLLLTHGADANAKDGHRGYRPVKLALDLGGREDIIELLKQYGGKE